VLSGDRRRLDRTGRRCYHFDSSLAWNAAFERERCGEMPEGETMPQLLVRDLDPGTVERLKLRAQRHGRSLQGEVKAILEAAAIFSMSEAGSVAEAWQRKLAGGAYTDSAEIIREDRER